MKRRSPATHIPSPHPVHPPAANRPFLHLRVITRYTCHDPEWCRTAGNRQQLSARSVVNIPVSLFRPVWGEKQKNRQRDSARKAYPARRQKHVWAIFPRCGTAYGEYHSLTCNASIAAAATVCCARTSRGLCGGVRFSSLPANIHSTMTAESTKSRRVREKQPFRYTANLMSGATNAL